MNIREGIDCVNLNHKPYSIACKSLNPNSFIVGNRERQISILSKEGIIEKEYEFDFNILSMDFDEEKEIISIVDEKGLHLYNYEKKNLKSYKGNYKSVFLQAGKIWSLRVENKQKAILEIYDLENYLLLNHLEIEDIFQLSSYMIFEAIDEKSIILWVAAGQDGQINYLIELTVDGLRMKEIGEFDTYPVKFSPNKKSFVNYEEAFLKTYSMPKSEYKKTITVNSETEYLQMMTYLDDNQILLQFWDKLKIYNTRFNLLVDVNIFKTRNKDLSADKDEIYSYKDFGPIERVGTRLVIPYTDNSLLLVSTENLSVRDENQLEFKF